jgi:hypothetical protein
VAVRYVYLGDKLTDPLLVGLECDPIRRADGKCLVGRKPRNQAVRFENGREAVVLARRLRLNQPPASPRGAAVATTEAPERLEAQDEKTPVR